MDTYPVEDLDEIAERLEEILDYALGEGMRGVQHKIEEALGSLYSAVSAARQFYGIDDSLDYNDEEN